MTSQLSEVFEHKAVDNEQSSSVSGYPYLKDGAEKLNALINVLKTTKLGAELLADAEKNHITITMNPNMGGSHGSYSSEGDIVCIKECDHPDRQVITLAHELRHAQQFKNGVLLDAFVDQPKNYLHSQGVIEADANVASCLVAWDLNKQGNTNPMKLFAEEDKHVFAPFYEKAVEGGIETGEAQKAAFKGWFTDEYIRSAYEKNYLRNFRCTKERLSMAEQKKAFSRTVSVEDNAEKVCLLDGKPYMSRQEITEFFSQPAQNEVGHETYWAIFRNLRDYKGYPFNVEADALMKKETNFSIRESCYYDAKIPSVEERQQQAAKKISQKKSLNTLNLALLNKKSQSR